MPPAFGMLEYHNRTLRPLLSCIGVIFSIIRLAYTESMLLQTSQSGRHGRSTHGEDYQIRMPQSYTLAF